jgi:hypothetical protein
MQGETHVPTVAEEPNLEVLAQSPMLCHFDGPWGPGLYKNRDGYYYDLEGVR